MSQFLSQLKPLIDDINQEIIKQLMSGDPLIDQVAEHILTAGGKRLRPVMFILAGRLALGDQSHDKETLRLSPVFELLHVASLLHDDLVDEADTRRGLPAAYKFFGPAEAVLTGDYLLAQAAYLGASSNNLDFMRQVSQTLRLMSEGELIQRQNRHNTEINEELYFKIIYRKTAALMESAAYLGALTVEASPKVCGKLGFYGRKLGLAFQIIDDCLDYKGESEEMGKPVGHDLDEGQITLPFISARDNANEDDKKRLLELGALESRTKEQWREVRDLVIENNGLAQAEKTAELLMDEALGELKSFAAGNHQDVLADLALYIVNRNT